MKLNDSTLLRLRKPSDNKYNPHQGSAERRRRLKQIRNGALKGDSVTLAARYTAIGLADPTQPFFIKA